MCHLLVINPNTSESVSALQHRHAQQAASATVWCAPSPPPIGAWAAQALRAQACQSVVQAWGVQTVILGGAGLAALIQPQVCVPMIDSVLAGTRHAPGAAATLPGTNGRLAVAWQSVSTELAALGQTTSPVLRAIL